MDYHWYHDYYYDYYHYSCYYELYHCSKGYSFRDCHDYCNCHNSCSTSPDSDWRHFWVGFNSVEGNRRGLVAPQSFEPVHPSMCAHVGEPACQVPAVLLYKAT